jgi:hypothetical protein
MKEADKKLTAPEEPGLTVPAPAPVYQCRSCDPKASFCRCGIRWGTDWQDVPANIVSDPVLFQRLQDERRVQVRIKP